jgi:outer membrane protein
MKLKLFAITLLLSGLLSKAFAQTEVSLEQVVALALEKNYDILISRKVSEGTLIDNRFAPAAFLPVVNATGNVAWTNANQYLRTRNRTNTEKIDTTQGPTAANNITGAITLQWTLFDGTRMFATRERVEQLAEQGQLALKDQMSNTIAAVISNYYNVVRQKQQLLAIEEQMKVGVERVNLAERKLEVGSGVKPELLQARVDLNAQRTQQIQQQVTIASLKAQLNALTGISLPQNFDVADTILIDLSLSNGDAFQSLENTNYQLLAARKNISVANLVRRERRAEYLPFLNFNAAYNYARNDNTVLLNPFSPLFNRTRGPNYGFTVTMPIMNAFNTRRLNQRARIEFDRQTLLYDQQKININVALQNAFVNYENAKKILLIEEETIGAAKENLSIALQTFKAGVTTSVELRIAQQSLADAYNRLITARFNAKVAETELLRLNGSLLK